jgi:hypothetical protein
LTADWFSVANEFHLKIDRVTPVKSGNRTEGFRSDIAVNEHEGVDSFTVGSWRTGRPEQYSISAGSAVAD